MDIEDVGVIGLVCLIIFIIVIELVAVCIVAGAIASWLGVSGILWWAVAIVLFLIINGFIGLLIR